MLNRHRDLGKSGLSIFRISFGGIGVRRLSAQGAKELLRKAVDAGINLFDTARSYGISEEYISFIANEPKIYIASKSMARDAKTFESDFRTSLRNLKRDHIDIYQIHNLSKKSDLEAVNARDGAARCLENLKTRGFVKKTGVTCHSPKIALEAVDSMEIDTIMIPYNPIERQFEAVARRANEKGTGVISMKPVAGGALGRLAYEALRFSLQTTFIDTVAAGIGNVEELDTCISALESDDAELSPEEATLLEEEAKRIGKDFCRRCGYCLPCARGIDIPEIFILMSVAIHRGERARGRELYRDRIRFKASECISCEKCVEKCPYNLPIPEMLRKAAVVLEM